MNSDSMALPAEFGHPSFHGSHSRKVDAKGRFHLPYQFRPAKVDEATEEQKALENYMLSPGPDGASALSPYSVWLEQFNARPEGQSKEDRIRNRRLMSLHSIMLNPDKQGRVALPPKVRESLGVEKEVLIVGMGRHMELWSPERVAGGAAEDQMPSNDYLYDFFD